jgi:F-type H+-transporting ATPase subunit epsilon
MPPQAMPKLHYKIVTPERLLKEGEASALTATTESGEITVLPGHIALATLLKPGEMRIRNDREESLLAVAGGLLEVLPGNEVVILAEEAYMSDELELSLIEEAKKKAEDALKNVRNREDVGFADAAASLERELAKYRVALKGKARRSASPRAGE